jgi:hypothetical protein
MKPLCHYQEHKDQEQHGAAACSSAHHDGTQEMRLKPASRTGQDIQTGFQLEPMGQGASKGGAGGCLISQTQSL